MIFVYDDRNKNDEKKNTIIFNGSNKDTVNKMLDLETNDPNLILMCVRDKSACYHPEKNLLFLS